MLTCASQFFHLKLCLSPRPAAWPTFPAPTESTHAEQDVDALLILPLYDQIDRSLLERQIDRRRSRRVARSASTRSCSGIAMPLARRLTCIEAPEYFSRPNRFTATQTITSASLSSRAPHSRCSKHLDWQPDVVHRKRLALRICDRSNCARVVVTKRSFKTRGVLFSIHNLAYQGAFDPERSLVAGLWRPPEATTFMLERRASALKAGIIAADALSTVSRRYAREIQTPEQGHGLDWLLRARSDRLAGITNGVDYDIWNPETDPHIAANFSADDLVGQARVQDSICLRRFGLPEEPDRPIIAIISRLVAQKGYDLIRQAAGADSRNRRVLHRARRRRAASTKTFCRRWHDAAPHRVGIYKGYAGEPLAHQIEAGADMFLMPSLYEPCGLNQMYSMRYGTVPIVRATGGLDDTVQQFRSSERHGNGFKFGPYNAAALLEKIREALYFYDNRKRGRRFSATEWSQTIPGRPPPRNTFSFTNRCSSDAADGHRFDRTREIVCKELK